MSVLDQEKDYLQKKTIWMFWTGKNKMSKNRKESYDKFCEVNEDCDVRLITHEQVDNLPNLHEGYQYLSEIQKGDYLKCYFLHHYGGGDSDIKATDEPWSKYFNAIIENKDLYAIGYGEKEVSDVARLENCRLNPEKSKFCRDFTLNMSEDAWSSTHIRANWRLLIGNGAFICRKNSPLTQDWWDGLNEKMNGYLKELKANPGSWPRDSYGHINPETGARSIYPIPWAVICGNIFHPLTLKYHKNINRNLPYPVTEGYQ